MNKLRLMVLTLTLVAMVVTTFVFQADTAKAAGNLRALCVKTDESCTDTDCLLCYGNRDQYYEVIGQLYECTDGAGHFWPECHDWVGWTPLAPCGVCPR